MDGWIDGSGRCPGCGCARRLLVRVGSCSVQSNPKLPCLLMDTQPSELERQASTAHHSTAQQERRHRNRGSRKHAAYLIDMDNVDQASTATLARLIRIKSVMIKTLTCSQCVSTASVVIQLYGPYFWSNGKMPQSGMLTPANQPMSLEGISPVKPPKARRQTPSNKASRPDAT
jgi:hypothetical protein